MFWKPAFSYLQFRLANLQELLCPFFGLWSYFLYQVVIKFPICGKCSILSLLHWTSLSWKGSPCCENWKCQKFPPPWLPARDLWPHQNQRAQLKIFKECPYWWRNHQVPHCLLWSPNCWLWQSKFYVQETTTSLLPLEDLKKFDLR